MATKRKDIETLVINSMEGRGTPTVPAASDGERIRFTPPVKRQIQIRFDPGDYEALQYIAYRKGTTAAALVRQLVKEYIKKVGSRQSMIYDCAKRSLARWDTRSGSAFFMGFIS